MTTANALKDLLTGRSAPKTPDISQFHYKLSEPSSNVEDLNTRIARQENIRQQFIPAWTKSLVANREKPFLDEITKLVESINKVDTTLDEQAKREADAVFRTQISREGGSQEVQRGEKFEGKTIAEIKKEINKIEKDQYKLATEGDSNSEEVQEAQAEDPIKKIERSQAEIAQLGLNTTISMFDEITKLDIYTIPGRPELGLVSYQYVLEKNIKLPDGSSAADHIRLEILSDIYQEIGLNKVNRRILKQNYFKPLQEWMDIIKAEEVRVQAVKSMTDFKVRTNEEFLAGVTANAGLYISGSADQNGTNGILSKWSTDGTLSTGVNNIIKELRYAEKQGDIKGLLQALHSIMNGEYYASQVGDKPISLKDWAEMDKGGAIQKLERFVVGMHGRLMGKSSDSSQSADKKIFLDNHVTPNLEDLRSQFPKGMAREDVNKVLNTILENARNDQALSTTFKDNLFRWSPEITSLINQMPTKNFLRDEQAAELAIKAHQSGNDNDYKWYLSEIQDTDIKKGVLAFVAKDTRTPDGTLATKRIEAVTGDTGSIKKLVEKYWKDRGVADQGGIVLDRAIADYTAMYLENLRSDLFKSEEEAHFAALQAVQRKLNTGNWLTRMTGSSISPYEIDPTTLPNSTDSDAITKNLSAFNALISGDEYKDNKAAILQSPNMWQGELEAINWMAANPGEVHPLYAKISRNFFPNISPFKLALMRQKFLIEKEWTPFEIDLYLKETGKNLNEQQWFKDKTHIQNINKILNQLEKKWYQKSGLGDLKYDVMGREEGKAVDVYSDKEMEKVFVQRDEGGPLVEPLNESSSAADIVQYITKVNGTDLIEPVFEMLYSRDAIRGNKFNHFTLNRNIFGQREVALEKNLIEHNIDEIGTIASEHGMKRLGIFGLTPREIYDGMTLMGIKREDFHKYTFNEELQGKIMWQKIRQNVYRHNNLSTLQAKNFSNLSRLNREERVKFVNLLKSSSLVISDITEEGDITAGVDADNTILYSPWHSPELLNEAILPYLRSKDYLESDISLSAAEVEKVRTGEIIRQDFDLNKDIQQPTLFPFDRI